MEFSYLLCIRFYHCRALVRQTSSASVGSPSPFANADLFAPSGSRLATLVGQVVPLQQNETGWYWLQWNYTGPAVIGSVRVQLSTAVALSQGQEVHYDRVCLSVASAAGKAVACFQGWQWHITYAFHNIGSSSSIISKLICSRASHSVPIVQSAHLTHLM